MPHRRRGSMELHKYKENITALTVLTSYNVWRLIDVHTSNSVGTDNAVIEWFPSPTAPKGIKL